MLKKLKKLKDTGISSSIRLAINTQIKSFGEIKQLELDTLNKSLAMEVELEGEERPVMIEINRYEIVQKNDRHFLTIYEVSTSKVWFNKMSSGYLEGKEFKIPRKYVKFIKALL